MRVEIEYQRKKSDGKGHEITTRSVHVIVDGDVIDVEAITHGIPALLMHDNYESSVSWRRV